MSHQDPASAVDLCRFIDSSPSPYHAVDEVARRLDEAGFVEIGLDDDSPGPGRHLVRSGGALVAWVDQGRADDAPVRIVGAHTDSPNLRLKPVPDRGAAGCSQLGVEVYGGVLLNSWLDRDLGISGRLAVRDGDGVRQVLIRDDRPLARIPQLAIHLDRGVNEKGLVLNPQDHLSPITGTGGLRPGAFEALVASSVGVSEDAVIGWDVMFHDLSPSVLVGANRDLVSAPRIDNLLSCHAGTQALVDTAEADGPVPVLALFDHEEVGSVSSSGAAGPLLPRTLRRFVALESRRLSGSLVLSVDGAHATHPNYVDRHDPEHPVHLNGGPVLKFNAGERYATDAEGAGIVRLAAERAGVPLQSFVSRGDLPCGSTIGPATAAGTGIRTVDLGVAQLAMHSARETCGSADPGYLQTLLVELLSG
ncbi:MAG: M18 family aminopeptidase [Actinomycetota bacterium]|nr:M18 family aminopeptidase [Actinomycetota bacterium]